MPSRLVAFLEEVPAPLREGLAQLRSELGVPDGFDPEVIEAAQRAADGVRLPDADLTGVPFVTIDPEGSMDLDQALHIEPEGEGFLVRYAIADVAAFVEPGGVIDDECHQRVETLYAPSRRTPLHPEMLSENAASLLPDQLRPALVWELHLDAAGAPTRTSVARARVRSRRRYSYAEVQQLLDSGQADEVLQLLERVGRLRERAEVERGGVSLNVPEQEVSVEGGTWTLQFRSSLPCEGWNAQISLLTGMEAARMMLAGRVGILRTLPPAEDHAVNRLRRTAQGLGISWPQRQSYPDFVRGLDPGVPREAAMLNSCTTLFRGAGYDAFDGTAPRGIEHAAIAAPYAHVTAPLRRLADRYAGEICVALCAGEPVPQWVLDALDDLPNEMEDSARRSSRYERGIVDLVEAMVLASRIGQEFAGLLIDVDPDRKAGRLQLPEPAVEARVKGARLRLGQEVRAILVAADLIRGKVDFRVFG
ncbi:RNB domain-containing ribonuclease [Micropruina sonneratiae]|uniref:RNB domain-containing ribonuclease n=1 Tax=Micropruina sonneratiae TaxID=2986940 RepID=UPI002226F21D|nr:RNB domain-containing ribonuclease [Micropruina sp. KQZ13P-5]MCW3156773.1 RNB domain-containing ribonuclease [Micropruina sp. KQZ13P-5]